MKLRYIATKASYKAAIATLETQKVLLMKNEGMVKKSDLQGLHDDIARLKTKHLQLEKDLKEVYEDRKPLQTALYKAIKTKIQNKINDAEADLGVNDLRKDILKQDLTQNKKDTNVEVMFERNVQPQTH